MPRLRVLVGTSEDDLKPIEANVHTGHSVSSDAFEGKLAVFLRMDDQEPSSYFTFREHQESGPSWSIQFQGRFLQERNADELYVGCKFANKLDLPWGTAAVMQFVRWVDPTLIDDLYAEKPWLLSPLLSAVSYLRLNKVDDNPPAFPPPEPLGEDCTLFGAPADNFKRKKHFASADKRTAVTLGPDVLVEADLVHGHMKFPSLKLHFPGGIEFNGPDYWSEGQRFMMLCCEKLPEGGPGRTFWCIAFEIDP